MKRSYIKMLIPFLICIFVFQSVAFAFEDLPFVTFVDKINPLPELHPIDIGVDGSGNIYIAEDPISYNHRISKIDESGAVLWIEEFPLPQEVVRIAVNSAGFSCVLIREDFMPDRVVMVDPSGSSPWEFSANDIKDIAINPTGFVYIAHSIAPGVGEVLKLDPSGAPVAGGAWPKALPDPILLATDSADFLFVVDDISWLLYKYDSVGNLINQVDLLDIMFFTDGMALGQNHLYLYNSSEVHWITKDLNENNMFEPPTAPSLPLTGIRSVAAHPDGSVYVAESSTLFEYSSTGSFRGELSHEFSGIRKLAIEPNGTIYAAEASKVSKSYSATPGFTVTESAGTTIVCESGTTDTFTVVLDSEPASNVILNIASSDISEATIPPASLTFTPTNWNTSQTVTVTGVDDSVDDGDQTSTITLSVDPATTDTDYAGLADQTLSVTTSDDDTAGFTLSKSSLTVSESGSTDTFTLVLDSEPTDDVNFSVISTDIGEATVDTPNPTFTPTNWNMPQTITVSGVNDDLNDGDQTTSIIVSIASTTDAAYASQPPQSVSTTTTDDDATGFTLSKTAVSVDESGTSETFTVVLDCQPASDVVFDVSSSDTDEAIVDSAFLTFTSMDWSTPQDVTVTGVDDDMDDGDQTSLITLAVNDSASDDAFDSLSDQTVTATTRDDDTAGFTLSKTAVSVDESGTSETFTVLLDCQPASDVVLDIASSDSGEAAVDVLSLTFTSMTWHAPQTVTVTGVDDPFDDNDQTSIITISIDDGSSDPAFAALANQTVTATTRDDDTVGFTLSKTEVTIEESGTTDSFTIVLDTMPSAPVFFDITNTDPSEAALIPHTISFSGIDWNTPQTITVIGQDDDLVDGDQTYPIQIEVTPESATEYLTVADQFVSATTINDDVAVPVESMELDHSEVVISEGYPVTLTATITPDDATEPVILDWLSSDPGGLLINLIDNLDGTATIEAVPGAEGYVVITGAVTNYYGSASAECQVTVLKPIDYLLHIIDQCACEGTLAANGDEDKLETFISSVEEVKALIEADDLLAAQSKLDEIYKKIDGNPRPKDLVIDGSTYNLAQMILDLRDNLSVPVTGVTLNHTDLTMFIRDTETLIATITPPDAINQDLIWTTSNKLIVRVNETGVITAKKTGTAIITVTTVDGGYTASCTVTVVKP